MRRYLALLLALVLFGAFAISYTTASSEVLVQNSWVSKEPMQVARSGLGVAAVNGKIYAIGGTTRAGVSPSSYTGGVVGTIEEYDPATDKWVFKKSMPTPRAYFAIAVFQNKIYCIGGEAGLNESTHEPIYANVNEVYDPATDTWETKTPMPTPRLYLDANTVKGKIYLIGGQTPGFYINDNSTSLALNEEYDPITDTWAVKAPVPYGTMNYASAIFNDVLYVFGGLQPNDVNIQTMVQMYDPKSDSWSFGNPSSVPIVGSPIAVTTGVQAPIQFNFIPDIFNPVTGNWSTGASMPTRRIAFDVAVVDDLIYAIGGFIETSFELGGPYTLKQFANNEQYIPVAYGDPNRYTSPPPTPTANSTQATTKPTPTTTPTEQEFPSTGVIAAAAIALTVVAFGLLLLTKKRRVFLKRKALKKSIGLLFCFTMLIIIVGVQSGSAQDQYFAEVVINASGAVEPANAPIQTNEQNYSLTDGIGSITAEKNWEVTLNQAGGINPSTAPITRKANIWTLNADITGSIKIEQNNIVFDGNNHTLSGGIVVIGDYNTITNTTIMHANAPVEAFGSTTAITLLSSNNNITGNYLSDNTVGINFASEIIYATGRPSSECKNNYIVGNTIKNCYTALQFYSSQDNQIYYNNFLNNNYTVGDPGFIYYHPSKPSINIWDDDNGSGNFWDDYLTRYPNATESNTPSVGDTPYFIRPAAYIDSADAPTQESKEYWSNMNSVYAQNVDRYPLMEPYGTKTPTMGFELAPTIIGIATVITIVIIALIAAFLNRSRRRRL